MKLASLKSGRDGKLIEISDLDQPIAFAGKLADAL